MAGHSKWSKVKHIKAVVDVRRGRAFSKLSKEITVAARLGGGNPEFNPRLRAAVQAARDQSMPNDNIDRAIKKGTGEIASDVVDELLYEGYGPSGVAVLVETATDNKNRTVADLRTIFSRNGGSLASSGSVAFQFRRVGRIEVPADQITEDRLFELVLESGAEELSSEPPCYVVLTAPDSLYAVAAVLKSAEVPVESQKLAYIATSHARIGEEKDALQALKLLDALEDNDDVLHVHSNLDVPDDLLERLSTQ
jgi:YebC/PmpR family DNA-binding regulatory protein